MDLPKIALGVLRQGIRALGRLLSAIPAGWLVIMGIVALPIAILSVIVALVFIVLLGLLALLGMLFYLLVWRPVFGTKRKQEKVIEAEYTVKSDDDQ
jgi:membrane protein implicated in regulation of membrane protease activity